MEKGLESVLSQVVEGEYHLAQYILMRKEWKQWKRKSWMHVQAVRLSEKCYNPGNRYSNNNNKKKTEPARMQTWQLDEYARNSTSQTPNMCRVLIPLGRNQLRRGAAKN